MTICSICGLDYVEGYEKDEEYHRSFHDRTVNGVRSGNKKGECVVWRDGNQRITLVTPFSSEVQRKHAEDIAAVANQEVKYTGGIYHAFEKPSEKNTHLFLYHSNDRILGLVIVELRKEKVWLCHWSDNEHQKISDNHKELDVSEPVWSVSFIWIHQKLRRQGIAGKIFDEVLIYLAIEKNNIGWYTPFTDKGSDFVRNLYPTEFLVAK